MRLQDDIDFTTLTWVKQELDDTLKQAQQALEAYVEDSSDKSQMRFCASYLHQVQGTLRMVELYGGAMVVEEMERLALGLLDGKVKQVDDAYTVLMRGLVQLPDYLERLQSGHRDIPIVLLPLLNDLRACRGEKLLSETSLFSPDLGVGLPASAAGARLSTPQELIANNGGRLRLAFQFGLLKWFKGDDVEGNLTRLIAVVDRVRSMCVQLDARRLFWVSGGVLEAVLVKGLDASVALKLLIGRVDREIKRLIDSGESAFASNPPNELTKGLLYYVAQSTANSQRVVELRQIYRLDKLIPSEAELEHARGALTGHNRALLETVGTAIKEDLLRVKDALDLYLRTGSANTEDLFPQVEALHRVADTLGMLGLGVPRRVVLDQQDVVARIVSGKQAAEESVLLDIAGSLLYVESSLDDHIERLGADPRKEVAPVTGFELPQAEVRRILDATTKEASANIQQAKQDIVAFIESPWDHSKIDQLPRLLDEISGALRMLNLPEPAELLGGVVRFAEIELLKHRRVPSGDQLDLMADAIASIEFFLEAVKEGRRNRDKILDVTRRSLEALGYWPIPVEGEEPAALDAASQAAIDTTPSAADFPSFDDSFTTERTQPPESPAESSADAGLSSAPPAPLSDAVMMDQFVANYTDTSQPESASLSVDSTAVDAASSSIRSAVEIAPGEGLESLVVGETAREAVEPALHDLDGLRITDADIESPRVTSVSENDASLAEFGTLTPQPETGSLAPLDSLSWDADTDSIHVELPLSDETFDFSADLGASPSSLEQDVLILDTDSTDTLNFDDLMLDSAIDPVADSTTADASVRVLEPQADSSFEFSELQNLSSEAKLELQVEAPADFALIEAQTPSSTVAEKEAYTPSIQLPGVGFHSVPSDEIDDEIRGVFVEEVQDELDNLNRQYPAWKKDLNDHEKLKHVRRSFHTLKGSGRLVGALAIGEFAWRIENMLNRLLDKSIAPTPAVLDLLDHGIAALPGMLSALKGEGQPDANVGSIMWVADQLTAGQEVWLPKSVPATEVTAEAKLASAAGSDTEISAEVESTPEILWEDSAEPFSTSELVVANVDGTPAETTSLDELFGEAEQAASSDDSMSWIKTNDSSVSTDQAKNELEFSQSSDDDFDPLQFEDVSEPEVQIESSNFDAETGQATVALEAESAATAASSPLDVDPMLMEILSSEVSAHLVTIDGYLARSVDGEPPAVTEELLRAVHTLNGALSMVDIPVLMRVVAPLEGYLKRLRARGQAPSQEGSSAIRDSAACIAEVMQAIEAHSTLPDTNLLSERVLALRDDLPVPDHPYHGFGIHDHDEHKDEAATVSASEIVVETTRPWYEADEETIAAVELTTIFDASDEQTAAQADLAVMGDYAELSRLSDSETPKDESDLAIVEPANVADHAADSNDDPEGFLQSEGELTDLGFLDEIATIDAAAGDSAQSANEGLSTVFIEAESSESLTDALPDADADHGSILNGLFDDLDAQPPNAQGVPESVTAYDSPIEVDVTADAADMDLASIESLFVEDNRDELKVPEQAAEAAQRDEDDLSSILFEHTATLASENSEAVAGEVVADSLPALSPTEDSVAAEMGYAATESDETSLLDSVDSQGKEQESLEPVGSETDTTTEIVDKDAEPELSVSEFHAWLPEDDRAITELTDLPDSVETIEIENLDTDPFENESAQPEQMDEGSTEPNDSGHGELVSDNDQSEPSDAFHLSAVDDAELMIGAQEVAPEFEELSEPGLRASESATAADVTESYQSKGPVDVDPIGPLDLPDMDVELLDIFAEEGVDILDHADGMMVRLRQSPEDKEAVASLQRDLHTLKGGARMAGLYPIGDLSHVMESLFEAIANDQRKATRPALEGLERAFDRMHGMVSRVRQRQAIALPEHTIARLEAILDGREDELPTAIVPSATLADVLSDTATREASLSDDQPPTSAEVEAPKPPMSRGARRKTQLDEDDAGGRASQELIRVRADMLDNLVNFAGEVSIYRSRLETQMGGFRFNLIEFEQTVLRLREQLRKLEMETEAQILSRYQRESEQSGNTEFDPLELDRFSTLQQLSRALAESVSDLVSIQNLLDDIARQSETLLLQQSRVSSDLQEGLMRTRMVPFESLVPRLRRILRQTATELGKKAQLRVEGTQGEMDRTVLERMTAPFEHMLRNSLAHGIESPEVRRAKGKSEEGSVSIRVSREATEVLILVTDDGGGMNRDAIRQKAIERNLMTPEAQLSDRDIFQFVLEAGFSTASEISKVAGRGVGMDVVASEVKQLGGSLEIDSDFGKGTRISIRLPFTLAVAQAVMVRLGDGTYAIPMSSITGVTRMPRKEMDRRLENKQMELVYNGETYQIYDLGDLLRSPANHGIDEIQVPLLMSRTGDQRAAIRVSQVIGSKEVVVKSAGAQLSVVPGIFGATIMGDGRVVVILDLAPLVRHGVALRQAPELAAELELREPVPEPAPRRQPLVMVVDDSITMRKVTTRVLERSNFDVFTAKDGLDAVEQLQDRMPDVILLDIEMPRMDGYEVATYIRNDLRLKHIPIIMITSRTGEKHRQRALEVGVDRYLGKPYQETDLLKNVQDALTAGHANVH